MIVTHLWNRFQPATVSAGTITLLKRICSNVCVSKAYAQDALLFVHTRFWTWSFPYWPHANRSDGGSHPWQWYQFLICIRTIQCNFFRSNFTTYVKKMLEWKLYLVGYFRCLGYVSKLFACSVNNTGTSVNNIGNRTYIYILHITI